MTRLMDRLASPAPYVVWASIVIVAVTATYYSHPYIFAFTVMGLGYLCLPVAACALVASLLSRDVPWRRKAVIFVSVAVAGAAILSALAVLRTFHWA